MMTKSYESKSPMIRGLIIVMLLLSCNVINSADRLRNLEEDEELSCLKRVLLFGAVITAYGTTIWNVQEWQRVEQARLTPICDNPASVGGFTLGSTLPVPTMQATVDGNDCECWKLDFVQCKNGSLSTNINLFSNGCVRRKNTPTPVVSDSKRDLLYQSALKLNVTGSKNVVIWRNRGCKMVLGEFMKPKED